MVILESVRQTKQYETETRDATREFDLYKHANVLNSDCTRLDPELRRQGDSILLHAGTVSLQLGYATLSNSSEKIWEKNNFSTARHTNRPAAAAAIVLIQNALINCIYL